MIRDLAIGAVLGFVGVTLAITYTILTTPVMIP